MLLLDTSFLIDLERETVRAAMGPAKRRLAAARGVAVAISIISIGEFAEGFESAAAVEAFISRFRVLQLSRSIAYRTALLQSRLPGRLGENDAWIAATALAYDATILGRESAFRRVPRLRYEEI